MLLPRLPEIFFILLIGIGYTLAEEPETNPVYLGCYGDDKAIEGYTVTQQRALPFEIKQFSDKRNCIDQCAGAGYKYAGLQNGDLCFCGENFDKYGRLEDSNCNIKCRKPEENISNKLTDNFFQSCGGRWANSVYSVLGFEYERAMIKRLQKSWVYNV